jgi:hypothetical protein
MENNMKTNMQRKLKARIAANLRNRPRRPTTNEGYIPPLATVSLVPQGPTRYGHTHGGGGLVYNGLANPSTLADVSLNLDNRRDAGLVTNSGGGGDDMVLPEQTLNWRAVSRANRSNYGYNAKAAGSYADVKSDSDVADQMAQRRRDEGSLDDPACVAEDDDDGMTNPG